MTNQTLLSPSPRAARPPSPALPSSLRFPSDSSSDSQSTVTCSSVTEPYVNKVSRRAPHRALLTLCRCVAVSLCHVGILRNLDAAAAKHFFGKWIFGAECMQSMYSILPFGRPCLISRGFLPLLPGLGPLLPPKRPGLHRELPPASRHSSRASTSSTGSTSPTSPTKSLTRAPAFNASHLDFLRLISAP